MCHTPQVVALPADAAPTRPWSSPVALVTGGDRAGRWVTIKRALGKAASAIREAGLIVCAVAAFVYGAFQIHEVAGWVVLGVGLFFLDWSRRDHGPSGDGDGPP